MYFDILKYVTIKYIYTPVTCIIEVYCRNIVYCVYVIVKLYMCLYICSSVIDVHILQNNSSKLNYSLAPGIV